MAAVLALTLAWGGRSPDSLEGRATYYAPGVMERVAANRGYDLEGYLGGLALNRKGDLGRAVWLEWVTPVSFDDDGFTMNSDFEGPFLVVDCAREGHYEAREQARYVVEVDAETAKRREFYGRGPVWVRVYFNDAVSCTLPTCPV